MEKSDTQTLGSWVKGFLVRVVLWTLAGNYLGRQVKAGDQERSRLVLKKIQSKAAGFLAIWSSRWRPIGAQEMKNKRS